MFNFYDSGILMAKIEKEFIEMLNPYTGKFETLDAIKAKCVFKERYQLNPLDLIADWDKMQLSIETAIKAGETLFSTEDSRRFSRNGTVWIQRNTMHPVDILTRNGIVIGFVRVDRSACSFLIKEGEEAFTPLSNYQNLTERIYAAEHFGDFMVEMRDGIKLSTTVLLPVGEKEVPVVLCRTPYGKENMVSTYLHYVQLGYGVVIQDTRGREASEGEWIPMAHESEDGDDTLTWIGESEFCNGSVGMIGGSYSGYVQWAAAVSGNPYLKTMVSIVTAGSAFVDMPYRGGCLMSGTLAWAFAMSERKAAMELMERQDWNDLLKVKPIAKIVEVGLGKEVPFWRIWCEEDVYNDFWAEQNWWSKRKHMRDIPVFILSGWYDDNGMGTTEAIDLINDRQFKNYRILLGPWLHKANSTREVNGIFLGKNAIRYDVNYEYLRWFERHLKGKDIEIEMGVEYYDVGRQIWEKSKTWPPTKDKMILSLKADLNAKGAFSAYDYDPDDSAPHIIDMSSNEATPPGDYQEIEKRSDVITFTSNVLNEDLRIAGDILVDLYAASSCKDTDWIVRVTDVDEMGKSMKVAENPLRAKFRNGYDRPEALTPNEIYRYRIRTSKIAVTFKKGHRIRLMITSGASGYVFANTNTGRNPALDTELMIAHQRIYHDEQHHSCLVLPIV